MSEEKVPPKAGAGNVKWLLRELPGWVAEGLIGQDAADKIAERYKLAQAAGGRAKLVFVLGILAAILLGTGVILFFASNWSAMPRFSKLFIICTALWGSYLSGYYLRFRRDYSIMGDALILLGTILFGAGIFLVAQAFNINAHFPNGALLWMLGLVPLVILMRSRPILAEITILFCIWIILEVVAMKGFGGHDMAFHSFEIRCFAGLVIFAGIAALLYRFGHKFNAALMVPAFVILLTVYSLARMDYFDEKTPGHVFLFFFMFFVAIGAVGVLHRRMTSLPPFAGVYQFYAILGAAIILYTFTFPDPVKELVVRDVRLFPIMLSFLFIAIVVAISVSQWNKAGEDAVFVKAELGMYLALSLLAYIFFYLFTLPRHDAALWIGLTANLVLFGFIISLIVIGYRGGYPRFINIGLLFFLVDLVTRYFDWFWNLMPRSLFFMAGGVILLVGGIFLEKQRKQWVLQAKEAAR